MLCDVFVENLYNKNCTETDWISIKWRIIRVLGDVQLMLFYKLCCRGGDEECGGR
jgi:hypothetical protein